MRSQSRGRVRRGEAEWRRLVARFEASRLSTSEFCERESVSDSSLQRWRKRFAEADAAVGGFVELPVPASVSTGRSGDWSAEVELPNGVVLRFRG